MPWVINEKGRTLMHDNQTYGLGDAIPDECAEAMRDFVEWQDRVGEERFPPKTALPPLDPPGIDSVNLDVLGWRNMINCAGENTEPDSVVDEAAITPEPESQAQLQPVHKGGGIYLLPDGRKVKGRKNADKEMEKIN